MNDLLVALEEFCSLLFVEEPLMSTITVSVCAKKHNNSRNYVKVSVIVIVCYTVVGKILLLFVKYVYCLGDAPKFIQ